MAATIKDIAQRIGKSTTTVSRALNDYADISPETKELVRRAAEELGYTPNTMAQRLKKQQSDTIGLIIPTSGPRFSDPFFSEFIAGIGNKAAVLGYDLLVATRAPGQQELETYRVGISTHRVDGFIVVRTRRVDERINFLRAANFPFVSFGRTEGALDFSYVDEDGEEGLRMVVDHLASLGHSCFGVIVSPGNLMFTHHRICGIKNQSERSGIHLDQFTFVEGDMTQRSGYIQGNALLDQSPAPTAIIAFNDLMALGTISAAQERGLVVGKDVSVTGFDNIPMAEHTHPSLTTVNQPIYQIGVNMCEILIRQIRGELAAPEQVLLKPALIVRQSTGLSPDR
jgi:LacI family transcriptional regulator